MTLLRKLKTLFGKPAPSIEEVAKIVEAEAAQEAADVMPCRHMTPTELLTWQTQQAAALAVTAAAGPDEVEVDGVVQLSAEERVEAALWRVEIAAAQQAELLELAATLSEVSRQQVHERLDEIFQAARSRAGGRGW